MNKYFEDRVISSIKYYGEDYYASQDLGLGSTIVSDPFGAILITFEDDSKIQIQSRDQVDGLDLTEIILKEEKLLESDQDDRPDHINEEDWRSVKGIKIISEEFIFHEYNHFSEKKKVLFGVHLKFLNQKQVFILNIEIENYVDETKELDFFIGSGALTIIFDEELVTKYKLNLDQSFKL